jgi:hypothetical protein
MFDRLVPDPIRYHGPAHVQVTGGARVPQSEPQGEYR